MRPPTKVAHTVYERKRSSTLAMHERHQRENRELIADGKMIAPEVAGAMLAKLWRGPVATNEADAEAVYYLRSLGHVVANDDYGRWVYVP